MITDAEKKSTLQTILQSREFKDSPVYKNLLSYLVESTLSQNIPKEITIAIDVFGKDSYYNSNKDSTVRYHVHILRRKLDDYYRNEGREDKIRLVIPKGHYEIEFVAFKGKQHIKAAATALLLQRWKIIVVVFIMALNVYLLYHQFILHRKPPTLHETNFITANDKIWNSFIENEYPMAIILGDDYLLDEYNPGLKRYRQIRDWEIDSDNDLNDFLIQYPKEHLWKSEITGIPFGGVGNLMDILPIAYQFRKSVSLKMSSKLSLEEIRNHNIIYIGELKNLRVLNKIIYKLPIRFQYHPDERLFIVNENGDTLNTYLRIEAPYNQRNKYNVDYSLLIKIPGFTNEIFMFIVGFGYGGRMERTKMISDFDQRAELIKDIQKINGRVPEYFIMLFEVKSIERTGFTNEIKYFKEIPREFFSE
jgi:hypothetical protein